MSISRTKNLPTVLTGESRDCFHPRNLCFSPDGSRIIAEIPGFKSRKSMDGLARWDSATGTFLDSVAGDRSEEYCSDLKANTASEQFAKKTDTRILIWNSKTLELIRTLPMPSTTISSGLEWSRSGRLLAANSQGITVWDVESGNVVAELKSVIKPIGFLSEEPPVLALGGNTGIWVWSVGSLTTQRVARMPKGKGYFWDHALSPDGGTILSSSERGTLAKTDTTAWNTSVAQGLRSDCGYHFSFSPDGPKAAVTGASGVVLIWDVVKHQTFLKWSKTHYHTAHSPCFAPDGEHLAVILDGELHILDFTGKSKPQRKPKPQIPDGEHMCVAMSGPDFRMDAKGMFEEMLNPFPVKCATCGMPDLDCIASPYLLGKGIDRPVDLAPAADGNFLIKPHVHSVLELVAPGQCRIVSTLHSKTKLPTPWLLAVPVQQVTTATPPVERQRCPECGEPWCFHHFTESENPNALHSLVSPFDVLKAKNWGCHKMSFKGWGVPRPEIFDREFFFSVRLEMLLKKLNMRGLSRSGLCKQLPSEGDLAWVDEQHARVREAGRKTSEQSVPDSPIQWFEQFLREHTKKESRHVDFDALERKQGCALPESFKAFATMVGQLEFQGFNGEEGLDGTIFHASELDFEEFENQNGDEESPVRALAFAQLNNGDSLCFDLSRRTTEPEVLHHDHETGSFEPFAVSFAHCVRMLVGR